MYELRFLTLMHEIRSELRFRDRTLRRRMQRRIFLKRDARYGGATRSSKSHITMDAMAEERLNFCVLRPKKQLLTS